jgi:hypothetical protein
MRKCSQTLDTRDFGVERKCRVREGLLEDDNVVVTVSPPDGEARADGVPVEAMLERLIS